MNPSATNQPRELKDFVAQLEGLKEIRFSDPDSERKFWGKFLLKKWLILYFTLWLFLTVALVADNDPLRSSALAMVLAFCGATFITLTVGAGVIFQARRQLGAISPEEKLLATVFAMALFTLYPFCWFFNLGWAVALSLTLLIYQSLVLLSRYSSFTDKLFSSEETEK